MTGASTIYSQIIDMSRMDNIGLSVDWTGDPTGVFSVTACNNGTSFHQLTFDPVLAQPAGSPGGYIVDINQFPWKYILLQYTNTSGDGVLTISAQNKDLN